MKTVIEMAREAGIYCWHKSWDSDDVARLERFAALVREDEREKQQEPLYFGLTPDHTWLSTTEAEYNKLKEKYRMKVYTTPPTAALAARQMRDAAVKVCRDEAKELRLDLRIIEETLAALPVPEVQWRDLTDEEIIDFYVTGRGDLTTGIRAVIAKFKEKQL